MKDNRLEQRIQHSLNAELSGLNTASWQRDQFFENATGGNSDGAGSSHHEWFWTYGLLERYPG